MQRILIFLFLLINHNTLAQEIKIISAADGSPLPFATVTNRSHPSLVFADRNGIANISSAVGDTLSVSYVGYKTAIHVISEDKIQLVRLLLNNKQLPAVVIQQCLKPRLLRITNYHLTEKVKADDQRSVFGGVIWTKGANENAKVAVRLTSAKAGATLKDFSFWIQQAPQAPDSSVRTPLLISLYEVLDSTNLPGEVIVNTPIFYFPKKGGKQTINLDSFHIKIPGGGIYVSLQYIMNETYEWKQFSWHMDSAGSRITDSFIIKYGGIIQGLRCRNFDLVWYDAIKTKWLSVGGRPISNNSVHSSIKCEATLTWCGME